MGNIVEFTGMSYKDIEPDKVLKSALNELNSVIVIGQDKCGEPYVATSSADVRDLLLEIEIFKASLLNVLTDES